MLRHVLLLAVAALALASCGRPITQDECTKAGEAGTWDVSFALSTGDPAKCPTLEKSFELPDKCEANCGCTEARVVFETAKNSALQDKCSIRFQELCPGYELDCRYVNVDSSAHAAGDCYYKAGSESCSYRVEWSKK